MKRTVSILISLALLLTMLPVAALAAGPRVYCYAPESWEKCYVYAWNDDRDYAPWPGEAAVKLESGIWYYDLPEGYENLLFHDGDGNQTYDLHLSDAKGDYRYLVEQQRWYNGNYTYTVVGNADFMGAWDPTSTLGDMVQTGALFFEKTFYDVQPGEYELIVVPDHEDGRFWGVGNENFRFTVTEPCEVLVTFEEWNGVIRVYLDGEEYLAFKEKIVHLYVNESWETVYAHTWEPETMGQWPGTELVKDGDWYNFTASVDDGMVQFHENVGYGENSIVQLPHWPEIWIMIGRFDTSVSQTPIEIYSPYTVIGNADFMGNWDVNSTLGDMKPTGDRWFEKTFYDVQPGDYELKVISDHDGSQDWGVGNGNFCFTVTETCDVLVTFEEMRGIIRVYLDGEEYLAFTEKIIHLHIPDSWSAVYAYTSEPETMGQWPGTELVKDGDWYTFTLSAANDTFVCLHDNVENGEIKWVELLHWPETWIVFNDSGYSMTNYAYKVVGDGDFMGAWDVTSDLGVMTPKEMGAYYEVTFPNVAPGEYNFKVVKGDNWDHCWGTPETNEPIRFDVKELTNITIRFGTIEGEFGIRVDYTYNRLGDFDGDGATDNIGGVARLFSHVRGKTVLAEELQPKADTNQDGKINIADVARLFKAVRTGEGLPTIPVN